MKYNLNRCEQPLSVTSDKGRNAIVSSMKVYCDGVRVSTFSDEL